MENLHFANGIQVRIHLARCDSCLLGQLLAIATFLQQRCLELQ
jgi:hypothetical protein